MSAPQDTTIFSTVNIGEPIPEPSSPDFIAYLANMEAEATAALGEVTLERAPVDRGHSDKLPARSVGSDGADIDSASNAEDEDRDDELSAALASAPMAEELEAAEIAAAPADGTRKKKKKRAKKKKASLNPEAEGKTRGTESHLETDPAGDKQATAIAKPTAAAVETTGPAAAQVSADVLSAHSVLAEFEGRFSAAANPALAGGAPSTSAFGSNGNIAASSSEASTAQTNTDVVRFRIVKYCKYAHLFPREASGLLKVFELPMGAAADAQTQQLADEADGSLSACVAGLKVGDRVELEWLQIRLTLQPPPPPPVQCELLSPIPSTPALKPLLPESGAASPPQPPEPPLAQKRVVLQCQKLVKLDARAEATLEVMYPKPQLMLPKGSGKGSGTAGAVCSACTSAGAAAASAAGQCGCGQDHSKPAS